MSMNSEQSLKDLENFNNVMSGVTDPAAEDQVVSEPQEEAPLEQPEQIEQVDDKEYNFRALRDELAQIKQDRDRLEREFDSVRRQTMQRQPEPPRKSAIDEVDDNDIVTGAQFKKTMAEQKRQYDLMLGEMQIRAANPDYDEVTTTYGIPLLEKEPDFAQSFLAMPEAARASYLYKISRMARSEHMAQQREQAPVPPPQPSEQARRMVENAKKPGTLSNPVGGTPALSKTDYYATMSDKEFAALVKSNLDKI